jgi:hypothetical protein
MEEKKPYSAREIDTFMKQVHEKLDLILLQTTRTNGRVSILENRVAWIIGVGTAIAFLITVGSNLFNNLIK